MRTPFGFASAPASSCSCFIRQRRVQRDEIGALAHRPARPFHPISTARSGVKNGSNATTRIFRPRAGNNRSDIAAADNAQHLIGQLNPHEAAFFPFAGLR